MKARSTFSRRISATGRRDRPAVESRDGAAAIELGILLPLLLTIALGAFDLGRFGYSQLAVANAARAGAAYASMQNYTTSTEAAWRAQLRSAVEAEMVSLTGGTPFTTTDLIVTAVRTVETDGLRRVRVTAQFPFETIISWPGIPEELTLSHAVEIRGIR